MVVDPLHEAAHRALMRLFAAAGRRQQALAQYHQLRDALRRELAAEPDPQTAASTGRSCAATSPPPPAGRPRPTAGRGAAHGARPPQSAPPQPAVALTSFVGRERELHELARLLDRNRLLTLTGAGGAGKTRLALEAGGGAASSLPDGVWLVELAGLRDPGLVPEAVAGGARPPARLRRARSTRSRAARALAARC